MANSSALLRAGRHLVGLSQKDLAEATGLSLPTIKRAESERDVSVSAEAVAAIRSALEAAGVIFVEQNGDGPGVRLKRRRSGPVAIPVEDLNATNDE